jgi:hypothetical protein
MPIFTAHIMRILFYFIAISFALISCKKKVIKIQPVVEILQDLSIPAAGDIRYFVFPTDQIGYAASEDDFIYKTLDGGANWSTMDVGSGGDCKGLEFFSADEGMCLMGSQLCVTSDGGETWTVEGLADFIGKTDDGIGIEGDFGAYTCTISESADNGQSFSMSGVIDIEGSFEKAEVDGSVVYVFTSEDYFDEVLHGYDLDNNSAVNIFYPDVTDEFGLSDVYVYNGETILVGSNGLIADESEGGLERNYYGHTYPFFSVAGHDDLIICAGEKTLVTNMATGNGERWNYVTDLEGNGFASTFYKAWFYDRSTLYLSGNDGLILKMKLYE